MCSIYEATGSIDGIAAHSHSIELGLKCLRSAAVESCVATVRALSNVFIDGRDRAYEL